MSITVYDPATYQAQPVTTNGFYPHNIYTSPNIIRSTTNKSLFSNGLYPKNIFTSPNILTNPTQTGLYPPNIFTSPNNIKKPIFDLCVRSNTTNFCSGKAHIPIEPCNECGRSYCKWCNRGKNC
eukprot:219480_1